MDLTLALVSGILGVIVIRTIALEILVLKLKGKNKLLCRENHRLRIKLQEHENSTKG
jgi:hypothetical protein